MKSLLLIALTLVGACASEGDEMLCIRHSNCPLGYYCATGECRMKNPPVVPVDSGPEVDSGAADSGAAADDGGAPDAALDASLSDVDLADVIVDAAIGDVLVGDVAVGDVAPGDTQAGSDVDLIGDAAVGDVIAGDAGILDATTDASPDASPDAAADAGPIDGATRDVPPADLGPDAGVTDRGFGSFPLPSFDTGFGKPR